MYTDNSVTPEIVMILFTQSDAIMLMQCFNKYATNFQEILQNSSRTINSSRFPGLLDTLSKDEGR